MQRQFAVRFAFWVIGLPLALTAFAVSSSAQVPEQFPQLPSNQRPASSSVPSAAPTPLPNEADVNSHPAKGVQEKAPAAIDPSGPATSLETSESVFDVMAALNICGYNEGLQASDPVRQKVRDDINQALQQSEPARESRDQLCAFIQTHTLNGPNLNLAAYISLALYLTPPPQLTPNVPKSDLPPDAVPLVNLVPRLKAFAQAVNLHVIWVLQRDAYEAEVEKIHVPLSQMIVQMDLYLKQPPAGYGNRRFVVILEPLIAPGEVNARVYGGDYIVVASPVNGKLDLKQVKHTYLHFELEPMIYARSTSIDALMPILELVQPAPLPYEYKSDILSLVTECLIRAIEAHTMDTGVPVYKIPAHFDRNQLAAVNNAENRYEHAVSLVRHQAVQSDMLQGFILTQYFYEQLHIFENSPTTLQEAVGEMIYGMNVDIEKRRIQDIVFVSHSDEDVLQRAVPQSGILDQAEKKLADGDTAGAAQLAQQALSQHTPNPGRAQFILARADIMSGKMEAAVQSFTQATQISHDPRTIAWSHIYLGRLDDLQDNRQAAITEYQAAMKARDGKVDTKNAAEAGLKTPFSPPQSARQQTHGQDDPNDGPASSPAPSPGGPRP